MQTVSTIGQSLMPIIQALMPVIQNIATVLADNNIISIAGVSSGFSTDCHNDRGR